MRTVGVLLLQDTLIHIRILKGKRKYLEKHLPVFFHWKLGNDHFKIQHKLYDPRGAIWYPTKHAHPEDSTRSAGDLWAAALRHCFTKCFNPLLFFRLRDPEHQILENTNTAFSQIRYTIHALLSLWHLYLHQVTLCYQVQVLGFSHQLSYLYVNHACHDKSDAELYTSVGWQPCSQSPWPQQYAVT